MGSRAHNMGARVVVRSAAAVLLTVALSSCAGAAPGSSDDSVPFATAAEQQLEALPGVDSATVSQTALDPRAKPSDLTNADLWRVALEIRMLATATEEQMAAVATAAYTFSKHHAKQAPWTATLLACGDATPYAGDTTPLPAIQVQVFPAKLLSAAELAHTAFETKTISGVNRVTFAGSLGSIDVLDAAQLDAVYDRVQHLALFEQGGRYDTSDGRVQIMDVPKRVSDASIHAIIALAVSYPGANIALTAPTQGAQYPELYLDHVSPSEAATIAASLSGLDRKTVTVGDYPLPFHMRSLGPESSDTSGFLGGDPQK